MKTIKYRLISRATFCCQLVVLYHITWQKLEIFKDAEADRFFLQLKNTKQLLQVIYAGDSAADEFAMEALKGVAYTYKVQFVLVSL
jgi:hypothetical protein